MRRPAPRRIACLVALASLAATVVPAASAAQPAGTPAPASDAAPTGAACNRVAVANLTFSDDDAFEQRLATALGAHPQMLTVEVARPFSPETIPDRAHAWLVETARQGGAVRRRDIPCGQPPGPGQPIDFGMRAFLARPGDVVAAAVRGYDAAIWVEQATGAVTQIQFTRRPA